MSEIRYNILMKSSSRKLLIILLCLYGGVYHALAYVRSINSVRSNSRFNETTTTTTTATKSRQLQSIPAKGLIQVLVILVQFKDDLDRNKNMIQQIDLDGLYNDDKEDPSLYPSGSIGTYLQTVSYNQFEIQATVMRWFAIEKTGEECSFGNFGLDARFEECFAPVLDMLDDAHERNDDPFRWEDFDKDRDGFIDLLSVMHSGYAAEYNNGKDANKIESHASLSLDQAEANGWSSSVYDISLGNYIVTSAFNGDSGSNIVPIGPVAHVILQALGLPELRGDNDDQGFGAGMYSVMSRSRGSLFTPNPGHLDPWSKLKLGWVNNPSSKIIRYDGKYKLGDAENFPDLNIVEMNYPKDEYLLIENRQPLLYDTDTIGSGGILIWHIDDLMDDNTRPGYPGQDGWPGNGNHYRVAVVQADRNFDLEKGENEGDEGDLFQTTTTTLPNTDSYQNGNTIPTGLVISKFAQEGNDLTFEIDGLAPFEEINNEPVGLPSTGDIASSPNEAESTTDLNQGDISCMVNINTQKCAPYSTSPEIKEKECDCFNFCGGSFHSCSRFQEMSIINCQDGTLVAGCQFIDESFAKGISVPRDDDSLAFDDNSNTNGNDGIDGISDSDNSGIDLSNGSLGGIDDDGSNSSESETSEDKESSTTTRKWRWKYLSSYFVVYSMYYLSI